MNILVIGSGGREHAVIKAIKKNPSVETIYCLPGNGGIAADATCVDIGAKDIEGIVRFATENKIDYAVVTPDDPLVLGCVDALTAVGIPCFGPDKKAAIIEGSKAFSKDLMKKYGIPTAAYEIFDDMDKGFAETLFDYIDKKGMTDVECYKKANVDKKTFSKIKCNMDYRPSKVTAVSFAIALRLDLEETNHLLNTVGMSLSKSSKFDVIIEYFITTGNYKDIKQNNCRKVMNYLQIVLEK